MIKNDELTIELRRRLAWVCRHCHASGIGVCACVDVALCHSFCGVDDRILGWNAR